LNPLYRDVLAHYGVTALPCRVRDPDRKGKVESGVAHAQKTQLKGKRFESLEEAQAYLDHWEEHWADTRISLAAANCRLHRCLAKGRTPRTQKPQESTRIGRCMVNSSIKNTYFGTNILD